MTSSPPHLNLTVSSLGPKEPRLITKTHKKQNKLIYTEANTQIQNTSPPFYNNTTHMYTINTTDNKNIQN